ncbi:MAG: orotate phosphoribosyltransferase [Patescibacteria group bacterium]
MDIEKRNKLFNLMISTGSIKFGKFTLASGRESSYYCDGRIASTHPDTAPLIGQLLLQIMDENNLQPDSIGGLETGAIPIVGQVQAAAHYLGQRPLKSFYVRKQPKGHGTKSQIEGNFKSSDKVVIFEDVTTSGTSAGIALDAVLLKEATVCAVICLLDRQEGAQEYFKQRGIPFYPLFTKQEFLNQKK